MYNITLNENKSTISANSITLLGYTLHNNQIAPDYNRLKPLLKMSPPKNLKSQKQIVGMFSYYSKFIQNFSNKILLLSNNKEFPLTPPVLHSFEVLKNNLKNVTLITVVTWCPTEKIEIRLLLFPVRELTVASRQSKECGSEWRPTDVGTL